MDYSGRPIKRSRGNDYVLPDDLAIASLTTTGEIKSELEVQAPSMNISGSEVPPLPGDAPIFDQSQANYAALDVTFPTPSRAVFGRAVNAKRAVQTTEFFRPEAMPINGLVSISLSLVSDGASPGNNFFFGIHLDRPCVDSASAFGGSLVGEEGYFFHSQSDPGTSYLSEDGVRTLSTHPGSITAGIHLAVVVRTSIDQWAISFLLPGGTAIGEFITVSFPEHSRAYFIFGDNSTTSSGYIVDGIEVQATNGYGVEPQDYSISQSTNGSLLVGPGICRADGNEVCFKPQVSCMSGLLAPEVEVGRITCDEQVYERPPPTVDDMLALEWDFVGTEGVLQIPAGVRFISGNFARAITSKSYFVPNDLEVGGFLEMTVLITNSSNYRPMVGVAFKNEATVYEGNGVGASPSENYITTISGTTFGNRYVAGGIIQPAFQEPNFSATNAVHGVKVTRTSANSWEITYSGNGIETGPPTPFGPEYASRFCYWYLGKSLTSNVLSEHDAINAEVTYDGWDPRQVRYTITQDESNALVCADTTGNVIYKFSPNEYTITKPLLCQGGISANSQLFGYSCPVPATFFTSVGFFQATAITETEIHSFGSTYGSPTLPTMNPGSVYTARLRGWLLTNNNTPVLVIRVYIGAQLIASNAIELVKTDPIRTYWELDTTIVGLQNLSNTNPGNATVKATGAFTYQSSRQLNDKNTIEGVGLFTLGEPIVPLNAPGEMIITAAWDDPGDILSVLHSEYVYSGFNV